MTIAPTLLSLLVAAVVGRAVTARFDPAGRCPMARSLVWIRASATGVALLSMLHFLRFNVSLTGVVAGIVVELAALVAALVVLIRHRSRLAGGLARRDGQPHPTTPPIIKWRDRLLLAATAVMIGFVIMAVIAQTQHAPHGQYDAWAMWNYKARLLFHDESNWRNLYADGVPHRDYPLLWPMTIARAWAYTGDDAVAGPMTLAVVFATLVAVSLWLIVLKLRGVVAATVGLAILLSSIPFVMHFGSQYADIPSMLFVLLTLGAFAGVPGDRLERSASFFVGLLAGVCAWTKIEGQAFAVSLFVVATVFAIARFGWRHAMRSAGFMLLGLLPVLICIGIMRLDAPATQGWGEMSFSTFFTKLSDGGRHEPVLTAIRAQLPLLVRPWFLGVFACFAALSGVAGEREQWRTRVMIAFVLLLVAVVIYLGFVVTPSDQSWHLQNALDRVFFQFWPSIVLLLCLVVKPGTHRSS